MTIIKIKGFKIYQDRHGKVRCYHRATGTPIDLVQNPIGSAGFIAECGRLSQIASPSARPGTLGLLISKYRDHDDFRSKAPRTRADYQKCFDYLKPIADTELSKFTPPLIIGIRDKAGEKMGRKWGTYVKTCLSLVFSWGVERGYLAVNPALNLKGLKRPKDAPEANRPWKDQERYAVLEALPPHLIMPINLMMFCGLDPGDVVKLPKTAIAEGRLNTRRQKTKQPIWVSLPSAVIEAMGQAPKHDAITLCATSKGKPWSKSGLDSAWQPLKARLFASGKVQPGLTLKGLRHTVATVLAEMGCDERTIADMLGQKTIEMARHYSRRADKTEKMDGVVVRLDAEMARRRTKNV
jgi:integrase